MQCSLVSWIGNRVYVVWELPGTEYWTDWGENPSKPQSCVKQNKTLAVRGFVWSDVICSVFLYNYNCWWSSTTMFDRVTVAIPALQRVTRLQWSQKHLKSYCTVLKCSEQWTVSSAYCLLQRLLYQQSVKLWVYVCQYIWSMKHERHRFRAGHVKVIRTLCAFCRDITLHSLRYS